MSAETAFYWISVAYLFVLIASFAAAVRLWILNDANESGAANRPSRRTANMAALSLAMVGAFASVVLFFLSQAIDGQSKVKVAEANKAAKQAAEVARSAQLEGERIKARLAWRDLTETAFKQLVSQLKTGHGSVTLAYTANDPEALNFAILISAAFKEANPSPPRNLAWEVIAQPRIDTDKIHFGISITGQKSETVSLIRKSFQEANIIFGTGPVPNAVFQAGGFVSESGPPLTDVLIMIGSKPFPFGGSVLLRKEE